MGVGGGANFIEGECGLFFTAICMRTNTAQYVVNLSVYLPVLSGFKSILQNPHTVCTEIQKVIKSSKKKYLAKMCWITKFLTKNSLFIIIENC
jgi:hypothetical protein